MLPHASLVVVYGENSFAAAVEVVGGLVVAAVVEIEVVDAPFDVAQLMQRQYCNLKMPPTFSCYSGILVSAILVVYWGCWLLAGDADCPFRDGTRSRLESLVDEKQTKKES